MATKELGNVKIALVNDFFTSLMDLLQNGTPVAGDFQINPNMVAVLYSQGYRSMDGVMDYLDSVPNWAENFDITDSQEGHILYLNTGTWDFAPDNASVTPEYSTTGAGNEGMSYDNVDFSNLITFTSGKIKVSMAFNELFNIPFRMASEVYYSGISGIVLFDMLSQPLMILNFYPFNDENIAFRVNGTLILEG